MSLSVEGVIIIYCVHYVVTHTATNTSTDTVHTPSIHFLYQLIGFQYDCCRRAPPCVGTETHLCAKSQSVGVNTSDNCRININLI